MSFVAKIFVDYSEVGPACGPFDLYSITDNTGIYGENCAANEISPTPFLTDVPKGNGITGLTANGGFTFTAPSPLTKKIQIRFKGNCSGKTPIDVCIVGIPTPTPTPTPTATPTVTPTPTPACVMNGGSAIYTAEPTGTPTPTPTATATPTVTPTPTATSVSSGRCWTLLFNNLLPTDMYVRYRNNLTTNVETVLINTLEVMDNGDGTFTAAICVAPGGSYNEPVFVQGGIEQAGGSFLWSMGDNCTTAPVCFINSTDPTPTPTPTATPTATPTPYYLQLQPCSQAPGTGIVWTINAYTQSQIQVGDIFWSAGGAYYQVINYQQAQPNPVGTIDGSKAPSEIQSCADTPNPYVAPPVNPGVSILIHTGQTFSNSTEPCNMYESEIGTDSGNVFLSGHTIPANGDYAYTTAACNQTYVGNSNYYASLVNSIRYAFTIGDGGYINNVTACGVINTSPNWQIQYQTCDNCTTYDVYRDTNNNSTTSGQYKYNDIVRGNTAPSNGACITTQVQGSQIGTYYSCVSDQVSGQGQVYTTPIYGNNSCYSGPNRFLWDGTWVSSDPSNNESDVTGANWLTLSTNCVGGKIENTIKDFGPCSPTWGQTTTVMTNVDCVNYSSFGYFANSCNDADTGQNLYLVVKNEQLNNYRYNDEYGELVSGTIYSENTGNGSFAHNFAIDGTLSSISSNTCN